MQGLRASRTTSNDTYRREARRLRARFGHDRPRLYRSLRTLSVRPETGDAPHPTGPAGRFAALVANSMDDNLIRYSQRLDLLRNAQEMGIGRFEANLIIAAVQHREGRNDSQRRTLPSRRSSWVESALLFTFIQSVIVAILWAMIHA